MGGLRGTADIPRTTRSAALTEEAGTGCCGQDDHTALPGLHLINEAIDYLRAEASPKDGTRGCTAKKAGAYFGFRVISYTCLPLIFNLLSALICGILAVITLPLAGCTNVNKWCWDHFKGSCGYTLASLFDLTCDVRQLTGMCCCDPDSPYLEI